MIVQPKYISLKNWAGSLLIDFPDDILPILRDEEDWEEWAVIVANTGSFKRANIPTPYQLKQGQRESAFKTWNKWAAVVYLIMTSELPEPDIINITTG